MQRFGNLYFHGSRNKNKIALTFDDGPSIETEKVLDILKGYNAKATFFILGQRIEGREKTIERMVQEGHEIGNHSYEHRSLCFKSKKYIKTDLERCDKRLSQLGIKTDLFRPPKLRMGYNLFRICRNQRKRIILCDAISNDWMKKRIGYPIKRILEKTKNGSIVNLHDYLEGIGRNEEIILILENILPKLKEKYEFATVAELLN